MERLAQSGWEFFIWTGKGAKMLKADIWKSSRACSRKTFAWDSASCLRIMSSRLRLP